MAEIRKICLREVLPKIFDEDAERCKFASSQVMLRNVDFEKGSVYCLDAASGTGKTSLCSFIFGTRADYVGEVFFDSINIRKFSINDWCEIRRNHLAYLPQELDVFDELSAIDNVLLKNRLTDFKTVSEILRMFERLEVDNRVNVPAGRLSVGQKQRVALIRALCQPFDFIILDEPVSHLDAYNNRLCSEMVMDAVECLCAGVVFTSVGNPLIVDGDLQILKL